jgi:hypothetical protein
MSKVYASLKQKSQKEPRTGSKPVGPDSNGKTERIQHRAYEIYQERIRKNIPGDTLSDWVRAEREVNTK